MEQGPQRQAFYAAVFDHLGDDLWSSLKRPQVATRGQQTFKSGAFGAYWLWFAADGLRVVVYLDRRGGTAADNTAALDGLRSLVPKLEELAGEPVRVDVDGDRRAQWIGFVRPTPDLSDPTAAASAVTWAAERAADLLEVLDRPLRNGVIEPVTVPRDPVAATPAQHAAVQGDEWDVLRWELARALQAMGQGWLSISSPSTANEVEPGRWSSALLVQVHLGDVTWTAECTSDRTLLAPHLLTPAQHTALERLGWQEPDVGGVGRPGGLNHQRRFAKGDVDGIAALLVTTARDVFRLHHDDLDYTTGTGDGRSWALPYLRLPMDPSHRLRRDAPSPAAAERFEMAIAVFRQTDIVLRENDGDHLIPFADGPTVVVRLAGGATPYCKIFSLVRKEVALAPEVLSVVNRLNGEYDLGKVLVTHGLLIAAADLPIGGVTESTFHTTLSQVVALAKAAEEEVPVVAAPPAPRPGRPAPGYL